jgi:hypothetical protein
VTGSAGSHVKEIDWLHRGRRRGRTAFHLYWLEARKRMRERGKARRICVGSDGRAGVVAALTLRVLAFWISRGEQPPASPGHKCSYSSPIMRTKNQSDLATRCPKPSPPICTHSSGWPPSLLTLAGRLMIPDVERTLQTSLDHHHHRQKHPQVPDPIAAPDLLGQFTRRH